MDAIALTALSVGLFGGVHCIAMCGGIVGAFTLRQTVAAPPLRMQLSFNAGRIASYALAGALAGGAGGVSVAGAATMTLLPLQTMLFVLANGLLILLGLYLAGRGTGVLVLERAGSLAWPLIRSLGAKLPSVDAPFGRFAAGAVWGWTPCGLVYSMLALALVSGSATRGAAVMLAFGLGSLPNLLGAGWILKRIGTQLRSRGFRSVAGFAIAAFGVIGLARVPDLARHVQDGLFCLGG
jgi:sulfite exporter TauE/SafE